MNAYVQLASLVSVACFIVGLKQMSSPKTARRGNLLASLAMLIAIVATMIHTGRLSIGWIVAGIVVGSAIGAVAAVRVQMTAMPEMVALFNGSGGLASALVALGEMAKLKAYDNTITMVAIGLSVLIGAVTLTGSVIAYGKLAGKVASQPITYRFQNLLNGLLFLVVVGLFWPLVGGGTANGYIIGSVIGLLVLSLGLGVLLVIPIGGADMPVVISLLNSYSGLAACATGFVLRDELLITAGALVGAAGMILTALMCKAMNRSLGNVVFGAFGVADSTGTSAGPGKRTVRDYGIDDAAMVLDGASSVIIVPGYGLAVARAQHVTHELAQLLEKRGTTVKYAIHPVAGRMPGHMNVLLAEANVPYEQLMEMDQINPEFETTDVALVLGANDVINPCARTDKSSPIYGMPILDVDKARTVIISKRSLATGFAGVDNELFYADKTMMIFGDARKTLTALVEALRDSR